MLQNEYLVLVLAPKIDFGTPENEPSKIWQILQKNIFEEVDVSQQNKLVSQRRSGRDEVERFIQNLICTEKMLELPGTRSTQQ